MRHFPLFMIFLCLLVHPAFGGEDIAVLTGYGLFQSRTRAQMKAWELEDEYAPPGREYTMQDRVDILTRLIRDQLEALGKAAGRHIGRNVLSMDNGSGGHRRRPSGSEFSNIAREQMRAWEIEDEYGPGDFTYDRNDRYNYLAREVNRYLRKMHEREPFEDEEEQRRWWRHLGSKGGKIFRRFDDDTDDMDAYREERRGRLMDRGYRVPFRQREPDYMLE